MLKSPARQEVQRCDINLLPSKERQTGSVPAAKKTCYPIIIGTTSGKPDEAARKVIRSQVMRGKNRTKPLSNAVTRGAWIHRCSAVRDNHIHVPSPSLEFSGTGLSMVTFADKMQPYMLDLVFKCKQFFPRSCCNVPRILTAIVFTVLEQALFPIAMCISPDLRNTVWLKYMYIDAAYLQSTLWATQSYFDWITRTGPSKRSMLHESKTLALLQHRLKQGSHDCISDSTIAVVVVHVLIPALVGDLKTATTHMDGLFRMVRMRGGVGALHSNAQLQIKVCRADLCISLATGRSPLFFTEADINWGCILAAVDDERWVLPPQLSTLSLDLKLACLWADLKCFSGLANLAFQTGHKLRPEIYQDMLTGVMYRATLLDIGSQTLPRTLHLSMLAFGASVFLQADGMKARLEHFSTQLHEVVCAPDVDAEQDATSELMLWSLFIIGSSAFGEEDDAWILPDLRDQIRKNGIDSWGQLRLVLKKYLWIDALHDGDGKVLYRRALAGSDLI